MAKLKIEGNKLLNGEITISGAKNSAVALIPAAVLSRGKSIIYNVPEITDIEYIIKIMELLNCKIEHKEDTLFIDSSNAENNKIPEELSIQMRASYYFMGALLARFNKCEISFPGGCKIGNRPIDLHIKGFEALGATVSVEKGKYLIEAKELIGTTIYLDFPSVGATINLMLAATGAKGETIIDNAAKEPEIVNVASYLMSMGAKITGAGTDRIIIEGNNALDNGVVEVIPDRIEAGTYLIIGAVTAEKLVVKRAIKEHVDALLKKFGEVGVKYEIKDDNIIVYKSDNLKSTNLKTLVFPGFPTDLQQPFTTLLTQATGRSTVLESIFESRFRNTEYLNLMGANTNIIKDNLLEINGATKLYGKEVLATDLRAGASLMVAALIAEGETIIDNAELIMRGYENVVEKLESIGAKIEIIE
jgi:UDP-N-acetylglucosamine 1-carboxyvinyltransferase